MVYFAMNVGDFYLSKAAMIDLGIIDKDFPKVGTSHVYSVNSIDAQHEVPGRHPAHSQQGALYEVQDELPSVQQLSVQPPGSQSHGLGRAPPCPRGLSTPVSPTTRVNPTHPVEDQSGSS